MVKDPQPSGKRRRSHAELIAAFDVEVRRTGSMSTLHNHAVAERVGLHPTDQECIDLLDRTGPLPAGEIGAHLGLSSGAVTALVDRLESGGWVRRARDDRDRRKVIVHLGGERLRELAPFYEPLAAAVVTYRDAMPTRDLRVVVEFLEFTNGSLAASTEEIRGGRDG